MSNREKTTLDIGKREGAFAAAVVTGPVLRGDKRKLKADFKTLIPRF